MPSPTRSPNATPTPNHSKIFAIAASVSSVGTQTTAIVTFCLLRRRMEKKNGLMMDLDREDNYANHHSSKAVGEGENGKEEAIFGANSKAGDEETKAGISPFAPSTSAAKVEDDQYLISDSPTKQTTDKPESSNTAYATSTSSSIDVLPAQEYILPQAEIESPPLSPSSRLDPLVQTELDTLREEIRDLQAQVQITNEQVPPPRYE